jgi:hypothetical protein
MFHIVVSAIAAKHLPYEDVLFDANLFQHFSYIIDAAFYTQIFSTWQPPSRQPATRTPSPLFSIAF